MQAGNRSFIQRSKCSSFRTTIKYHGNRLPINYYITAPADNSNTLPLPAVVKSPFVTPEAQCGGKVVIKSCQGPSDVVVMTGAIRELRRQYPAFIIDVETSQPQLWENNPNLTTFDHNAPDIRHIDIGYDEFIRRTTVHTIVLPHSLEKLKKKYVVA